MTEELARQKTKGRPHTQATSIDIKNEPTRRELIQSSDIVISMLPATFHTIIAQDCLTLGKNLVTPSYISPAMKEMDAEARAKGLIFMNEMGLDPGIDHMSAMQGDGGIKWKEDGEIQEIGYHDLFSNTSLIGLKERGMYESYPNRDSLKYIHEYGLEGVETIYRGTLRVPPFCEAWDCLVQLGLTSPTGNCIFVTKDEAIEQLDLSEQPEILYMLEEIGIFEAVNFPLHIPPAESLQKLLEEKWKMIPNDRDLVVMVHEIDYKEGNAIKHIQSSLYLTGEDGEHTAMALTVGLPLAIVTKLILNNQIKERGVLMPKHKEVYEPVMKELEEYRVSFREVIS